MAKVIVRSGAIFLRLNPIEKLMDLRLTSPSVPLSEVREIAVVQRPGPLVEECDFGFAGNNAPAGFVVTAKARGVRFDGGKAGVFVYLRRPSVRVDLLGGQDRWRLFLASSRSPKESVESLRQACGLGPSKLFSTSPASDNPEEM